MKSLGQKATEVFTKLIDGLKEPGDSRKINENRAFMPVHVNCIYDREWDAGGTPGLIYSVAHYFEQEGDLCCDPDVTFLVSPAVDGNGTKVFPLTFQQAVPPIYQEAATVKGSRVQYRSREQADLVRFCNGWMKNIESQQELCKHKSQLAN